MPDLGLLPAPQKHSLREDVPGGGDLGRRVYPGISPVLYTPRLRPAFPRARWLLQGQQPFASFCTSIQPEPLISYSSAMEILLTSRDKDTAI